jgi:hypothetical protein
MVKYRRTGWSCAGFDSVEEAISHLGITCWWDDPRTLNRVVDTIVVIKFSKMEVSECQEATENHILKRSAKREINNWLTKVLGIQKK